MGRGTGCYRERSIDTRINFQEQMRKPKVNCPKCDSDEIKVFVKDNCKVKYQCINCDKIF